MKRTLVFWMWNDVLEPDKIRRQLHDFKSQGVDGFFIHPMPSEFRPDDFPGGMPGYLSDHYFKMVRVAVECAAELDMDAWLYDEGGWPSGILNGYFMEERPELGHRQIKADGTVIVSNSRPDLLNPEVTRIFIEKTHEKYFEYVGEYFGTVIPGIFTDEPSFGGFCFMDESLPFSPVLEEVFRREKGYEAREAALKILNEHDEKATIDYYEVWLKLIRESFLFPIQKWCHDHNLLLTGHFNGDDCVRNMITLLTGDLAALHEGLDVCGCDAIWRQIHPLVPETDFSRMTVSAARGKRTLSETFAVYGSDLSLAEMKQVASMQFIAGVEIIAPMALHYSDEGGRQVTTVSNLYGADPRWQNYRFFADFSRRMSKVFDRTTPVIKAHVPYPVNDLRLGKRSYDSIFPEGLKLAAQQVTYDYSADAVTVPESVTPDIQLASPCPELRTRHLKSPRGERRIFANAGLNELDFKFAAPAGYNAWFDPSDGSHYAAVADENGMLKCKLPFAGTLVLLTIPGKAAQRLQPAAKNNKLALDFRFDRIVRTVKASPAGLVETANPAEIPPYFCGTIRYTADAVMPQPGKAVLNLPHSRRAMCALEVNGKMVPQVWTPYCWEVECAAGKNTFVLEISNTPFDALNDPSHRQYMRDNKFENAYVGHCDKFEKIFPDEKPLSEAYLEW